MVWGAVVGGLLGLGGALGGAALGNAGNIKMQREAQAFNHAEGQIGRDWQSDMFEDEMSFNSAQRVAAQRYDRTAARISFNRSKELRATQYQTAVDDLKKAGLNPMLAYTQGGAGTPSVSTPSSRGASVGGAGGATVGHSTPVHLEGYGGAVQSAMQMARGTAEVQNLQAQNKLIIAQAAQTNALTDKARQDTLTSTASAGQLYASTAELKMKVKEMQSHVAEMEQNVTESAQRTDLHFAHSLLMDAQRALTEKEGGKIQAQEKLLKAEGVLRGLEIPRAENEARMARNWYGKHVAPYTGEIVKGAATAAAVRSLFSPKSSTINKTYNNRYYK